MRRQSWIAWAAVPGLLCAGAPYSRLYSQTKVDLAEQGKNVDFSAAASTKPFKAGITLPAACSVGEAFFKTDATPGKNWYGCTSTNVWSLQAPSYEGADFVECRVTVSGSQATVQAPCRLAIGSVVHAAAGDAVAVLSGTPSNGVVYFYWNGSGQLVAAQESPAALTCNSNCMAVSGSGFPVNSFPLASAAFEANAFVPGGVTDKRAIFSTKSVACGDALTCIENAASGQLVISADTSNALLTKTSHQSGQTVVCDAVGAAGAYTCAMAPRLTGYSKGMVVEWIPDVSHHGPATLNIDGLGARPVKSADGAADPADGEIQGGRQIPVRYDGNVFRLPAGSPASSLAGEFSSMPACGAGSAGLIYVFTDSLYSLARCDGFQWTYFYDGRSVTPPGGLWNWENQDNATVSSSFGFHQLVVPGNHVGGLAIRYQDAPAGDWSRVFLLRLHSPRLAGSHEYAVGLRDAAGKLQFLHFGVGPVPDQWRVSVRRHSSALVFVSDEDLPPQRILLPPTLYVRISASAASITFEMSTDGMVFDALASVARASYLSEPAQIFYGAGASGSGSRNYMDVISIQ